MSARPVLLPLLDKLIPGKGGLAVQPPVVRTPRICAHVIARLDVIQHVLSIDMPVHIAAWRAVDVAVVAGWVI